MISTKWSEARVSQVGGAYATKEQLAEEKGCFAEEAMETTGRNGHKPVAEHGLTVRSIVTASKEQISCDLVGEAVILDLKSGVYYGLDSVGAKIWTLIQQPIRVADIVAIIIGEYEVDTERCEKELLDLLAELRSRNLIDTQNETAT
jgi:hypothetical protein